MDLPVFHDGAAGAGNDEEEGAEMEPTAMLIAGEARRAASGAA